MAFWSKRASDAACCGELGPPCFPPPLKTRRSLEAAAFVYSTLPPTKVYPRSPGVLGYANISLH